MYFEINDYQNYSAALYIRLSKEDENRGQSESVINQKSLLEEFTQKNKIFVYSTYIDDGWSGTGFERPGFKRMIADIEANKVNMIITKDLSRLGRDYIMTGHYMERYFPEKKVRYISLLDGIDTGVESTANDITPFRAIMNDMYAKDISKKIKSVKRDKQRKGQFIGGKPMYGYKKHPAEKNKIIIDEEAAPVVQRIFAMAAEGMSCRKIAETLNKEGILSPADYCGWNQGRKESGSGKWSGERISDMLQNETYIGSMVQGRTVKISYKSKKCLKQQRENWVVVENTHEPLIAKETFEKAGIMLSSRRRTRSRTYDFLLKGLIFCHECGSPLGVLNRPPVSGENRLFFVCRTYQRSTKSGECSCHSIKEQSVNEAVISKVKEICTRVVDSDDLRIFAENAVNKALNTEKNETEIKLLQKRIDGLSSNMDKLYIDRLTGQLNEVDFDRILRHIKEKRADAEEKLEELKGQKACGSSIKVKPENLVKNFIDFGYSERELLVSLIERVELTEDKQIIIKFRFRELEAIS